MEKRRELFEIPGCTWKRKIGDLPKRCASDSPNRGVALGGFGAGNRRSDLEASLPS